MIALTKLSDELEAQIPNEVQTIRQFYFNKMEIKDGTRNNRKESSNNI